MQIVSHFYKDVDPVGVNDYESGFDAYRNGDYRNGDYRNLGRTRMSIPTEKEMYLLEKLNNTSRGTDIRYTTPIANPDRILFYSRTRGESIKQLNCIYNGDDLNSLSYLDNKTYINVTFVNGEVSFYQDTLGNWYDSKVMKNTCPYWSKAKTDKLLNVIFSDIRYTEEVQKNRGAGQLQRNGGQLSMDSYFRLVAGHNPPIQSMYGHNPLRDQDLQSMYDHNHLPKPKIQTKEEVKKRFSFSDMVKKINFL